jgi:UDP-N-acetylmuramoyl-tripeptide--D-alanyl-D-alanine ligase
MSRIETWGRFTVLKSQGNLNNAFGLPLQLLRLEAEHEVAVIEMGMNHAGEIAALARIAEPDWAVVTNVAPVHLEHFADGIAGIARAKYELVEALPPDGIAFLNCDDEYVTEFGRGMGERAVCYGTRERARVRAVEIAETGDGVEFTVVATSASSVCCICWGGTMCTMRWRRLRLGCRAGYR